MRGASIDRDEPEQTMTFGSSNEFGSTRDRNEADGSTWSRIRTQNKPESAWDRIRVQHHPVSTSENSDKQDTYTTWNDTPANNRNMNSSDSNSEGLFPRTREDFEQARNPATVRRNKYGDVIDE
jgi:hypothetical protein